MKAEGFQSPHTVADREDILHALRRVNGGAVDRAARLALDSTLPDPLSLGAVFTREQILDAGMPDSAVAVEARGVTGPRNTGVLLTEYFPNYGVYRQVYWRRDPSF